MSDNVDTTAGDTSANVPNSSSGTTTDVTITTDTTPRSFTQDDVDRIVKDRLKRQSEQFKDHDAFKDKAAKYDELQAESQSELEKAIARAEKAEKTAADAQARADARLVEAAILSEATRQKAVKPEHLYKLVDLGDVSVTEDGQVEGASDAVGAFLEANPEYVGTKGPGAADQGARESNGIRQLTRAELQGMTPDAIVAARKEGRLTDIAQGKN